jgi:hypothetical protein
MGPIRWEKLAPLTGVVAVILWVIGVAILEGADAPDTDSPPAEALSYFQGDENAILAGTFVFMLGALFFLWFVGSLRAALYWAEGRQGRLSATAFAGGIATGISALLLPAGSAIGALNNDDLSAEAAQVLLMQSDMFFYAAELAAAVLLIATALIALRTQVLPVWLAWITLLIALVLLIPPIGWAALIFGVTLWTILVALLLYVKPPPPPGPPPITSQFVGTD